MITGAFFCDDWQVWGNGSYWQCWGSVAAHGRPWATLCPPPGHIAHFCLFSLKIHLFLPTYIYGMDHMILRRHARPWATLCPPPGPIFIFSPFLPFSLKIFFLFLHKDKDTRSSENNVLMYTRWTKSSVFLTLFKRPLTHPPHFWQLCCILVKKKCVGEVIALRKADLYEKIHKPGRSAGFHKTFFFLQR